jgi:hypothetical protein
MKQITDGEKRREEEVSSYCITLRKRQDVGTESGSTRSLDVRGSVHHSIIHKENPTRCNSVSKFYFIFI